MNKSYCKVCISGVAHYHLRFYFWSINTVDSHLGLVGRRESFPYEWVCVCASCVLLPLTIDFECGCLAVTYIISIEETKDWHRNLITKDELTILLARNCLVLYLICTTRFILGFWQPYVAQNWNFYNSRYCELKYVLA